VLVVGVLRLHVAHEVLESSRAARADAVTDAVLDLRDLTLRSVEPTFYLVTLITSPLRGTGLLFEAARSCGKFMLQLRVRRSAKRLAMTVQAEKVLAAVRFAKTFFLRDSRNDGDAADAAFAHHREPKT